MPQTSPIAAVEPSRSRCRPRWLLLAAAVGALAAQGPAWAAPAAPVAAVAPDIEAQLDRVVAEVMAKARQPGVAIAVRKNGRIIYEKGFGLANVETGERVTPDTVFPIGSITKSFTGLSIMQLVEAGKISLDAPLKTYLPDLKGPARDIALNHLLDHTSGLRNYTADPDFPADIQAHRSHEQTIGYVIEKPLLFNPGDRMSYSNTNTFLLGMVIEKITGQSYADYLKANVFEPFGMKNTQVADYRPIIPNRARGYDFVGGGQLQNAQQYDVDYPFSAGSIQSTVGDLLLYQQGVFEGTGTSQAVRDRILHARTLNDGTKAYYAQGCLIVRDFEGHRKISHSGDIEGFSAHYAYYPDDGVTIVLLTNVKHTSVMPFAFERKLARVALGIAAPKIVDLPVAPSEIARVAGSYDVKPFAFDTPQVSFEGKDGRLFLNYGEGVPLIPLLNQGGGKFVLQQDDEHTFTFSAERPRARTVVREFYDGSFPAVRHDGGSGKP